MRRISIALAGAVGTAVLAGGVLAGCGGESAPAASSLVGTWEGTATGYSRGTGEASVPLTIVIADADDANGTFTGERRNPAADAARVKMSGPTAKVDGVVSPWGEIAMVHDEGTFTLEQEGDQLVGRYLEVGDDAAAKAVTLTKKG